MNEKIAFGKRIMPIGIVAVILSIAMVMGISGIAQGAVVVTDTVAVESGTATFNLSITGATNITEVWLFSGTEIDDITTEVANWTEIDDTEWENTTVALTDLDAGTYYYTLCFCDDGSWDNATIGTFEVTTLGSSLGFTADQANEVALIIVYAVIFGVTMFGMLFWMAKNKRSTMVSLKRGQWWAIAIAVALVVVVAVYWFCNVYSSTDWIQELAEYLGDLIGGV